MQPAPAKRAGCCATRREMAEAFAIAARLYNESASCVYDLFITAHIEGDVRSYAAEPKENVSTHRRSDGHV
jgi:hypothetical protein